MSIFFVLNPKPRRPPPSYLPLGVRQGTVGRFPKTFVASCLDGRSPYPRRLAEQRFCDPLLGSHYVKSNVSLHITSSYNPHTEVVHTLPTGSPVQSLTLCQERRRTHMELSPTAMDSIHMGEFRSLRAHHASSSRRCRLPSDVSLTPEPQRPTPWLPAIGVSWPSMCR